MDAPQQPSQSEPHAPSSGFMQDTPPRADVDEILRRKRKAREYKVSMSAECGFMYARRWNLDAIREACGERERVFSLPNWVAEPGALKHVAC
jgi:hypothetical protein